jgi:hypothetical protein
MARRTVSEKAPEAPHRGRATVDVVEHWKEQLVAATATLEKARTDAVEAEMAFRACVLGAFEAGLSVTPIMEATGKSLGRIYQIKRGTRR